MPKPERVVLVCQNTRPPGHPKGCCSEKGSEALFDRLKALVREGGLEGRVLVIRTGCLKRCECGPTMAVYPDAVWYAGVRDQDLEELCRSHLAEGRAVEGLRMPDGAWE
jgi:(2Fe-2S) ferredoxin